MTTTVARIEDEDAWRGWCGRVLTWFLSAAGLPEQRSVTLVDKGLSARFYGWGCLYGLWQADELAGVSRRIRSSRQMVRSLSAESS